MGDHGSPVRAHIEPLRPVQRGNVRVPNLQVLNAILYVAENGCKWRGLPEDFGPWHTIYMRMNRWSQKGVRDRVCARLQELGLVRIKLEVLGWDSTIVPVHPDGTGAEQKRSAGHRPLPRRLGPPSFIRLPRTIGRP